MPTPQHYRRAKEIKLQLQLELGAFCKDCGAEDGLEFDCIEPQGDKHHRMNSCDRVYFYRKQHESRNIQLLCERCHAKKTARDMEQAELAPF